MRSVLISGATGGLGRNAVEFASHQGWSVKALGRNKTILHALQDNRGVMAYANDLCNTTQATLHGHLDRVDAVWHCAALSSPWGPLKDFYEANVLASEHLYQAAASVGVPVFVHISTPALYFDFTHKWNIVENFRPAKFINHYAATKAQAEDRLKEMAQKSPWTRLVILRPRAIFGAYDQVLLPRMLRLVQQKGGVLTLPHGGERTLDLTYVENVVHAMRLASELNLESCSTFNITNQQPMKIKNVLHMLFEHMGKKLKIRSVPYPLMDAAARMLEGISSFTHKEPAFTRYTLGALAFDMTLDNSNAQQTLQFAPPISMSDGIERAAQWMKKHHG